MNTDGITALEGADAVSAVASKERRAAAGGADPLATLLDDIAKANRPELAFDRPVIDAAAVLRDSDGVEFQGLRRKLKSVGVTVGQWDEAVARRAREREAEERDAAKAREVESKRTAPKPETVDRSPERAHHHGLVDVDGTEYHQVPGRTWMQSIEGKAFKTTTLANFSAPVIADLLEYDAPNTPPRRSMRCEVIVEKSAPRIIEVPARDFDAMAWVKPMIGTRASVAAGKMGREHLRIAIERMSKPTEASVYHFGGWITEGERRAYLHAGGSIGREGDSAPIEVRLSGGLERLALPTPPEGDELRRGVDYVLALLDLEPAHIVLPVIGQAFRAVLGEARCSIHVFGGSGVGKSLLTAFGQGFFGAGFHEDNPILSWRGKDSALGMLGTLASAGDCTIWIDDLKKSGGFDDQELMGKADQVLSSVFSGKGRAVGRREGGGARTNPAPRSVVLSSGEVLPRSGNSLVTRILPLLLGERMTHGDVPALRAANMAGTGASFMAGFVRWVARFQQRLVARVREQEVKLAADWQLGTTERGVKLLGAVGVGLRTLFAYLESQGVDALTLQRHERRAQEALREAALAYQEVADEQNPADTFVRLLAAALASGRCHVTTKKGTAPKHPDKYGWRAKSTTKATDDDGAPIEPTFAPCGERIGYVDRSLARVYLIPDAVFAVVLRYARETGAVVNIDRADLGRQLHQRGYLVAHTLTPAQRTYQTRCRVEGSSRQWLIALRLDAVVDDPEAGQEEDDTGVVPVPSPATVPATGTEDWDDIPEISNT